MFARRNNLKLARSKNARCQGSGWLRNDVTGANTTGLTIHIVDGGRYALTTLLRNMKAGSTPFFPD
jgi:hypothetical protein